MSLIKTAIEIPSLKKILINPIKDEAAKFANGHLATSFRNPKLLDTVKHMVTTKSGLKAIAPLAGTVAGAGAIAGYGLKKAFQKEKE